MHIPILLLIGLLVAAFAAGYWVCHNNPPESLKAKIKAKL